MGATWVLHFLCAPCGSFLDDLMEEKIQPECLPKNSFKQNPATLTTDLSANKDDLTHNFVLSLKLVCTKASTGFWNNQTTWKSWPHWDPDRSIETTPRATRASSSACISQRFVFPHCCGRVVVQRIKMSPLKNVGSNMVKWILLTNSNTRLKQLMQ